MTALALIATFVLLGATFASSHVVETIGSGIIPTRFMTPLGGMVMMLTAAFVTAANTYMNGRSRPHSSPAFLSLAPVSVWARRSIGRAQ